MSSFVSTNNAFLFELPSHKPTHERSEVIGATLPGVVELLTQLERLGHNGI